MNESGRSVGRIAAYYRVDPENIVVVHDDLDLELARVKVVVNRGPGGHNGIVSLISHLGSRNFARIRFGIGRPQSEIPVSRFVLTGFSPDEQGAVDQKIKEVEQYIKLIVEKGAISAMNLINKRVRASSV